MPTGETPRFELAGTTVADAAADLLATAFAGGADTRAARARALVSSHSTWVLRGHHDVVLAALAAGPTLDASAWIIEALAVLEEEQRRHHPGSLADARLPASRSGVPDGTWHGSCRRHSVAP